MPLYEFTCGCGLRIERLLPIGSDNPVCPGCKTIMAKTPAHPVMVKIPGEGGYPSRRRQIFNSTKRIHPKLD